MCGCMCACGYVSVRARVCAFERVSVCKDSRISKIAFILLASCGIWRIKSNKNMKSYNAARRMIT